MLQHVKKVIGIEMCSEAVEDAKANAALNGKLISNKISETFIVVETKQNKNRRVLQC